MTKLQQIIRFLNETGGKTFYLFVIIFIISSVLETLGLSLVIPVVALILEPNFFKYFKKTHRLNLMYQILYLILVILKL